MMGQVLEIAKYCGAVTPVLRPDARAWTVLPEIDRPIPIPRKSRVRRMTSLARMSSRRMSASIPLTSLNSDDGDINMAFLSRRRSKSSPSD
jgi:hypothetical protein